MSKDEPRWTKWAYGSFVGFGLGVYCIYSAVTFDGIPSRSELATASGHISWVRKARQSIRFRIDDAERTYQYSAKSGQLRFTYEAISASERIPVSVLYDARDPRWSVLSKDPFFEVYEISTAGKPVRAWAQVGDQWRRDMHGFAWLGIAAMIGGGFLGYLAIRAGPGRGPNG